MISLIYYCTLRLNISQRNSENRSALGNALPALQVLKMSTNMDFRSHGKDLKRLTNGQRKMRKGEGPSFLWTFLTGLHRRPVPVRIRNPGKGHLGQDWGTCGQVGTSFYSKSFLQLT